MFKSFDNQTPFYKKPITWIIVGCIVLTVVVVIIITVVANVSLSKKNKNNVSTKLIPNLCGVSNGEMAHDCYGGWFYQNLNQSDVTDDIIIQMAEQNAEYVKQKNWNYVFFSGNIKSSVNKTILLQNIRTFSERNISFHLMTLQDNSFIDKSAQAVDRVSEILDFLSESHVKIAGVHIDTEPQSREDWKSGNNSYKNQLFQKYIRMIEDVRTAIDKHDPSLLFSAAVSWQFSANTSTGVLDNGRGFDLVISTRLHMLVPMLYYNMNTVARIMRFSRDYITDKVPTLCGMAVRDYESDALFRAGTDGVFAEMAKDADTHKYFYGVSVFANKYYYDWPAT